MCLNSLVRGEGRGSSAEAESADANVTTEGRGEVAKGGHAAGVAGRTVVGIVLGREGRQFEGSSVR